MTPEQLEALKSAMSATWSPAVWIGREHVLDLIAAAEREAKVRAALERITHCDPIRAHNIARQALAENAETNSAGQGPDLPVKDASKPSGRTTPAHAESDTPIVDAYQRNNAIDFRDYSRITELARELERHARAMADTLRERRNNDGIDSDALIGFEAFCEEHRNG